MSLLRFVARGLFASYFIAEGVKAATKPAELAPDAERFVATVTPMVQRVLPADIAVYVPEKPETWVRLTGFTQVVGGVMYATGAGRRLGAMLIAKTAALNLCWALPDKGAPKATKEAARPEMLRNAALLGAAVLATQDTEGKPSMAWRAEQAAKETERNAAAGEVASRSAKKAAERAEREAKKLARKARRSVKELDKKLEAAAS